MAWERRRVLTLIGALVLAVAAVAGTSGAGGRAEEAKEPKAPPRIGVFKVAIPQPVPDRAPGATAFVGVLDSFVNVGRRYKGREISDVDVGVSVLGPRAPLPTSSSTCGRRTARRSSSPATTRARPSTPRYGTGDCTTGPTTFTDETQNFISDGEPPATFPGTVFSPWANIVQTDGFPLSIVDGEKAKGTWTLRVVDDSSGQPVRPELLAAHASQPARSQ